MTMTDGLVCPGCGRDWDDYFDPYVGIRAPLMNYCPDCGVGLGDGDD